mmetsp:Transcript_3935/g.13149  ORF Transcript_3935/g.13149 Transcript_3935/m.13149 type:complete len:214 (-) Transcript_3935:582-1223(-)
MAATLLYMPLSIKRVVAIAKRVRAEACGAARVGFEFASSPSAAAAAFAPAIRLRAYFTACDVNVATVFVQRPAFDGCAYVSSTSMIASIAAVAFSASNGLFSVSKSVARRYTKTFAANFARCSASFTDRENKYAALLEVLRPNGHPPSPPATGTSMNHSATVCRVPLCLPQSSRESTSCFASCAKIANHAHCQNRFVGIHESISNHSSNQSCH